VNDALIFGLFRRKKREWSRKPAGLSQAEVDEINATLKAAQEDAKPSISPPSPSGPLTSTKGPLAAIVGPLAATVLLANVPKEEGLEYKAYQDIASVWTICSGDTKDVRPGLVETPEGCRRRTEMQLVAHANGMLLCTPRLREDGRDWQRAAGTSLTYNIGIGAYCHSTADKRFDAGAWLDGCNAFISWNKARVRGQLRPVQGLTDRRKREIQICGTNLVPGWTPENLQRRMEAIA
jgi:lysozyme